MEEAFAETIRAARSGDADSLACLYGLVHPPVLRYLRVLEPADAEDLASDAWLDVATALERFDGDERALLGLALTIARRRAIDLRRRRGRRNTLPLEPERLIPYADVGNAEDEAMERVGLDEAIERVRLLPRAQAEVVLLRVLGGLSTEEVARIVGKRPGAVRVLQHRALRALSDAIGDPAASQRRVTR